MSVTVEVHHLAQATLYVYPRDPKDRFAPRHVEMVVRGQSFWLECGVGAVRDLEALLVALRPELPPAEPAPEPAP